MDLSTKDRIVLFLLLVIFCYTGYLFFVSTNTHNLNAGQKSIGKIVLGNNSIRRKSQDGYVWEEVAAPDKLYAEDLIYTGAKSKAKLVLTQGIVLELGEKTLIKLSEFNINSESIIIQGKVEATVIGEQEFKFKIRNQLVTINSKTARSKLAIDANKPKATVRQIEGDAQVDKVELAPATEEEFQNEVVAPKEEKKREKEAVLNSPALEPVAEPVTAPVAEPVTAPVAEPVTAPVAEPVTAPVAEPVTPSVVEPVARPAPKPAKVIPQKLKAPVLPKNQNFEIKINQKKSLPVENTRMPAAEEEEYYVDLTWPEVPGAKYYDVEIYTDTNEAIIKERVDINEWRWNRPKLGTYFWKIAAVDSNNIIGDYSNLETINLNFDFKKYFVIKNFKSSISRLRLRVSEEPTVTWKWDSVPLATSYRLRLSYSANFKNVFFEKEINENTFTWDATAFAKKNPDRPVFMDLVAIYNNSIFSLVERDRFIAIVKGSYLIKKQIDSSYLVFNYAPSQSTYKISSATIQGKSEHIIPISFQINSGFQLSKKSFVFSALEYKASKFFSDSFDPGIDYQDIGVESQYGRSLYNWRQFGFALSLGLRFHRLTEITASSSASIGGAEENYISLMVNTFLDQILNDRWAHYAKFGVGVGGLSIINFEYNLKHTIRRSVFANVGAKYIYKTTTGTTDIAITDEQIFLGLGWELPF